MTASLRVNGFTLCPENEAFCKVALFNQSAFIGVRNREFFCQSGVQRDVDVVQLYRSFTGSFQGFDILFVKFGRFLVLIEVCRGKKFLLLIDFLVDVA